LIKRVDLRKWI